MDEWYLTAITIALGFAVILNALSANIRGIVLAFVTIFLLCILSPKLDYVGWRNVLGAWWYIALMLLEAAFIQVALSCRVPGSPASGAPLAVATCSVYNLICHFIAMIAYNWHHEPMELHFSLIRIGEIAQVASLIFFTDPVARLVVFGLSMLPKRRKKENKIERRMVAALNR